MNRQVMTRATSTTPLKRGGFAMSSIKRKLELGLVEIAPNFVKGYCVGKEGFKEQIKNLQKQLNRR